MTIAPAATMNGMEAINRKGALRNKGPPGMGLNMAASEGWFCEAYANTHGYAVHKVRLGNRFQRGLAAWGGDYQSSASRSHLADSSGETGLI